jgi:predicted DNA binding CopG/RHH family protein
MANKIIPKYKTEAEERHFWLTHDSTEYVDWLSAKQVSFPNLQPSKKTISLRLPEILLNEIKILANRRDVPYQSLIKIFLAEKVQEQIKQASNW